MQIFIALCSNVLETVTVMFFGGPWGHIVWKAQVYDNCAQTYGKMRFCSKVCVLAGCTIQAIISSVKRYCVYPSPASHILLLYPELSLVTVLYSSGRGPIHCIHTPMWADHSCEYLI